jgi:hypothetical protein
MEMSSTPQIMYFTRVSLKTLTQEELLDALDLDGVYAKELKRASIVPRGGAIQVTATPFSFNIYLVGPESMYWLRDRARLNTTAAPYTVSGRQGKEKVENHLRLL